jgi:hypothetical protein
LVALAQDEELRALTDEDKLRQLASLMASVDAMGWNEALQEGDEAHWIRWQTIRARALRRAHVGTTKSERAAAGQPRKRGRR